MLQKSKIIIVGSGPCGVAAAQELLEQGHKVLLLEGSDNNSLDENIFLGNEEKTKTILAEKAKKFNKRNLTETLALFWNYGPFVYAKFRSLFGSYDYLIKAREKLSLSKNYFYISLTKGGLSNLWGATCYPRSKREIYSWPKIHDDLLEFYKKVSKEICLPAFDDSLNHIYPNIPSPHKPLELDAFAENILNQMNNNIKRLNNKKIYFGQSRIAVRTQSSENVEACVYCGLCQYGCPYGSIYTAKSTLDILENNKYLKLKNNTYVTKFEEKNNTVIVFDDRGNSYTADALFLAAGTLSTFKIVATSLNYQNKNVSLLDQDMYFTPFLSVKKIFKSLKSETFSFNQLVTVVNEKTICEFPIHTQYCFFNDYLANSFGFYHYLPFFIKKVVRYLCQYLVLGTTFIPSDFSRKITLRLSNSGEIINSFEQDKKSKNILKILLKKLRRNYRLTGLFPLGFLTKPTPAGFSAHISGTLPMKDKPEDFETNKYGKLFGYKKTYIIDPSCLPILGSQNHTYIAMANAKRIAFKYSISINK